MKAVKAHFFKDLNLTSILIPEEGGAFTGKAWPSGVTTHELTPMSKQFTYKVWIFCICLRRYPQGNDQAPAVGADTVYTPVQPPLSAWGPACRGHSSEIRRFCCFPAQWHARAFNCLSHGPPFPFWPQARRLSAPWAPAARMWTPCARR